MASKKKAIRKAIPYLRVAKLWRENKSYEDIAKAIHRFNPKANDPTKSVRATISNMLRIGYRVNGKTVKLPPRSIMRNQGVGKLVHKKVAVAKPSQGAAR